MINNQQLIVWRTNITQTDFARLHTYTFIRTVFVVFFTCFLHAPVQQMNVKNQYLNDLNPFSFYTCFIFQETLVDAGRNIIPIIYASFQNKYTLYSYLQGLRLNGYLRMHVHVSIA